MQRAALKASALALLLTGACGNTVQSPPTPPADAAGSGDGSQEAQPGAAGADSGADSGGSETGDPPPTNGIAVDGRIGAKPGFKVALLGDQGLGRAPVAALELVKQEGADLLVILGDFDYIDRPDLWQSQLDDTLGTDFPWLAVGGNHDLVKWDEYQTIIEEKLGTIPDIECVGEAGHQQSCSFGGVQLVLTRVGTDGAGHEDFIRDQLAESKHIWKICGWHKNQRGMQLGGKGDEVGWRAYRECLSAGAIIATGHEHSYGRTLSMNKLGDPRVGHGAYGDWDQVRVAPGTTFVVVSGMGGVGLRDYHPDLHSKDGWWATMYTEDWEMRQGAGQSADNGSSASGALFIEFGVDDDPMKAKATYKLAYPRARVLDDFEIVTE